MLRTHPTRPTAPTRAYSRIAINGRPSSSGPLYVKYNAILRAACADQYTLQRLAQLTRGNRCARTRSRVGPDAAISDAARARETRRDACPCEASAHALALHHRPVMRFYTWPRQVLDDPARVVGGHPQAGQDHTCRNGLPRPRRRPTRLVLAPAAGWLPRGHRACLHEHHDRQRGTLRRHTSPPPAKRHATRHAKRHAKRTANGTPHTPCTHAHACAL